MKAFLIHLGMNMWNKQDTWTLIGEENSGYCKKLACNKEVWRKVTDFLPTCGFDTLLIDMGEGVKLDRHPELAIEGSWSKEEFMAELERLRSIGLTPLPKFNFSCGHNAWLKDYAYMVGTETYDKVCVDVVEETIEMFGNPEFFHLGMEEETLKNQRVQPVAIVRSPLKKIRDCNLLFDVCRSKGVRPWIWVDPDTIEAFGGDEMFQKYIGKDVLISNWYYGRFQTYAPGSPFGDKPHDAACKELYVKLGEWGYEQIPTCSTWSTPANDKGTMRFCKNNVKEGSVKGYMTASWLTTTQAMYYGLLHDAQIFGYAYKAVYGDE